MFYIRNTTLGLILYLKSHAHTYLQVLICTSCYIYKQSIGLCILHDSTWFRSEWKIRQCYPSYVCCESHDVGTTVLPIIMATNNVTNIETVSSSITAHVLTLLHNSIWGYVHLVLECEINTVGHVLLSRFGNLILFRFC